MSNIAQHIEADCSARKGSCDSIEMVIQPRLRDLGGFSVRRVLPFAKRRMVGPWVFFDHLGPASFEAGEGIDVRPHPHIGLATVTYLFDGELLHRDSLGSVQTITPGAINWMTAGKGIVHSERTAQERRISAHNIHALQLWVALPKEYEMCEPEFIHYDEASLLTVTSTKTNIRVMIGHAYGVSSPVKTYSDTLYVELHIPAGETLVLPEATERALYIVSGKLQLDDTTINPHEMCVLHNKAGLSVTATEDTHAVIIGGEPLNERYMFWNFVASSKERLEEAKQAWRDNAFPPVPGETEWIPLPE